MHVDARRTLPTVGSAILPYRGRLAVSLIFLVVKNCPGWLMPIVTALTIDTIVAGGPTSRLWLMVGVGLVAVAVNYPATVIYVRLFSKVYRSLAADLRTALTARMQELSLTAQNRRSSSVLQTKVIRDVENVEMMLQQMVSNIVVALSVMIGAIVTTAIEVPQFLLVFLLTVPVSALVVGLMHGRAVARNEAFRREIENLSDKVGEMVTLMPVTRAHGLEAVASAKIAASAEGVKASGIRLDRLNARYDTTAWVSFNTLSLACVGLAGTAALTHYIDITAGQVVLLSGFFAGLTNAMVLLIGLLPIMRRGLESVHSIAEVLEDPDVEENAGRHVVTELAGRVTFEHVGFAYPDDPRAAVTDVDLELRPGEVVALVGASGSGKSTVMNLVLGFLRPTTGRITFDDVDMAGLDMRTVRRFISVVPQEAVLFDGTVRENVAYGLDGIPDDVVRRALVDANAAEFVDALPEGWHTRVGERGAALSGGQRQRLAIARALVRDPRILLLDEATSALDSESERHVKQALDRLMRGRTSLVVAHRLSTIRAADRIIVLEQGRIAEIGTHETLLGLGGRYAGLHYAQAS